MNIDDLTIKQAKELSAMFGSANTSTAHPFSIGQHYIVRTVTMIFTGKLIEVFPDEIVLVNASWIPETGRYAQFVERADVIQCEPFPHGERLIVGRGGIIDAIILRAPLPREQK